MILEHLLADGHFKVAQETVVDVLVVVPGGILIAPLPPTGPLPSPVALMLGTFTSFTAVSTTPLRILAVGCVAALGTD